MDGTNLESVFWDVETSGTEVGCGDVECTAVGESTANMKLQSTFTDVGWNFDTIWTFSDGINNDYAILMNGADDEVFEGPSSIEDDDGVGGGVEDAAPNEGDANDDGTPDSEQPKVTSLVSPVSGSYVVLESDSCTANSSVTINPESSNGVQDGSYNYPLGLLNFTLTGCSVGVTETITKYYYGSYDVSKLVVRKYNEATDTYATITGAVITAVTIGGRSAVKVVYAVTDGGALDADGIANGTIVDPAGIAVLGAASPNTGYAKVASSLGYAPLGLLTLGLYAYIRRYAKR